MEKVDVGSYKIPVMVIVIAIILLNVILKLIGITSNEVALDEPFTLFYAQQSISDITHLSIEGNNPPLYMYFMHFWTDWFGVDAFWSRLPSLIFSSVTAGIVFLIGKELKHYWAGIIAGGLYTFSSLNLVFAHEARMYALLTLIYTIALLFLIRLIKNPSFINFFIFVIASALAFYTHYLAGIMWITFLMLAIVNRDSLGYKRIVLAMFSILLLALPAILVLINRTSDGAGNTWLVGHPNITSLYNLIWAYANSPVAAVTSILLLVVGIIFMNKNQSLLPINLMWLIPVLSAFLISFSSPIFMARYLVFASIGFYLALGLVIETLAIHKNIKLILGTTLLGIYAYSWNTYTDNDRRLTEICQMVEEDMEDKNTACILFPDFVSYRIAYHCEREAFVQPDNFVTEMEKNNFYIVNSQYDINAQLMSYESLIVVDGNSDSRDNKSAVYTSLNNVFGLPIKTYSTKGYLYSLYRKSR